MDNLQAPIFVLEHQMSKRSLVALSARTTGMEVRLAISFIVPLIVNGLAGAIGDLVP
jgi:hypothetical protein